MTVLSRFQAFVAAPSHLPLQGARYHALRVVAYVLALLFHFTQGLLGLIAGVEWLFIANVASTLYWVATVQVARRGHDVAVYMALFEVLVHVPALCFVLGAQGGYQYFFFSVAVFAWVSARRVRGFPWLLAVFGLAGGVCLIAMPTDPMVDVPSWLLTALYIYNAVGAFASMMLLSEFSERVLKSFETQLVQSEKMSSLGNLVAGVAHELNTPIGAIQSSQQSIRTAVERAQKRPDADDPKLARLLGVIHDGGEIIGNAADQVARVVKSLRSFARLDEAKQQRIDVHTCIEDALVVLGNQLDEAKVSIERSYDELPELVCHPGDLNQVFFNLLDNARQAMPDGGTVRITSRHTEDAVVVSIEDDGEGIAAEDQAHIFDPGFTKRGVGVGAGLGLSTCWRIMERHHGSIRVESAPGEGATFRVELPLAAASAPPRK